MMGDSYESQLVWSPIMQRVNWSEFYLYTSTSGPDLEQQYRFIHKCWLGPFYICIMFFKNLVFFTEKGQLSQAQHFILKFPASP